MKKYISLLLISAMFAIGLNAQVVSFSHTASNPTGAITNTSIDTMYYTMQSYNNKSVGITYTMTRGSGTIAGTATLAGSIDGTTYQTVGSAFTLVNGATTSTIWIVSSPAYYKYRIISGGGTTVTATTSAKLIAEK